MKEAIKELEEYKAELQDKMEIALKNEKFLSYGLIKHKMFGLDSAIEVLKGEE